MATGYKRGPGARGAPFVAHDVRTTVPLMRILVSTLTPYPSGSAHVVHITATAQGFVAAGHETTLVSAQSGPGWPAGHDGVPRAPDVGFSTRTLAGRDYRGQSFVNFLRLRRLARRTRPDMCFADDVRTGLALASTGTPTIVELHTLHFHRSKVSALALRRLIRTPALRRIITISQALRDDLIAATGIDGQRITVVPEAAHALDDERRSASPPDWLAANMRPGALQVGFSGSLYAGRGAALMVELARRLPDIDLHVIGGPEAAAQQLRGRPDRPPNLHVHGLRPSSEAVRLQTSVDVLLAPYSADVGSPGDVDISRWFSPMKMFEYLASGRPMVCTDLPVLREILTDGETALLVPPDDVEAWVRSVVRLRDDAGLRRELGANGQRLHAARYTWEHRTAALLGAAGPQGPAAR